MKYFFSLLTAISLIAAPRSLVAGDSPQPDVSQTTSKAFVGVFVAPVHPALAARMPELSSDQGLIVESVSEDSPASKAGLQVHDILTTYDDQKLFSPEQFAKLVRADKVGREVTVQLLRDGKPQKLQLVLGKQEVQQNFRSWQDQDSNFRPRRMWRRFEEQRVPGSEWANFDSMMLKKIEKDKFRAEIQYFDKEQKLHKHTFEGTRDEIRKAIVDEKDLSPHEREHLLRSLNLGSDFPFFNPWLEPGLGWRAEPLGGPLR